MTILFLHNRRYPSFCVSQSVTTLTKAAGVHNVVAVKTRAPAPSSASEPPQCQGGSPLIYRFIYRPRDMDHNYKYPYSHAISGLLTFQSWILILVVQIICNCSVDFSCVQGSVVLRMKFAVKLLKKNASMDSTKTMLLINGSPFLEIQLRHARNRSLR